jgi:molybdopterin synthase catalytic subunit
MDVMRNAVEFFNSIDLNRCKTIQSSAYLEELSPEQKHTLSESIAVLIDNESSDAGSTVVFRGVGFDHLLPILTKNETRINEDKLISLLFYFGEKAKSYYKVGNAEAEKSRWIKKIEDCSKETAKVIFEKIKNVLSKENDRFTNFKEKSPEFYKFFLGRNKSKFVEAVQGNERLRDYYLFFLHTAGKIGIGEKSFLISTSTSHKVPCQFFNKDQDNYVICYVIPPESEKYSISHLSVVGEEYVKSASDILPLYNGNSLYMEQDEIAVKGALFSHHMLGVMKHSKSGEQLFIPNPHLFLESNTPIDILSGLFFDQSFFEVKLEEIGCYRGVGLSVDAQYSTIHCA